MATATDIDTSVFEQIVEDISIPCEASAFHRHIGDCEAPAEFAVVIACPNGVIGPKTVLLSALCLERFKNFEKLIGIDAWKCPCGQLHSTLEVIRSIDPING